MLAELQQTQREIHAGVEHLEQALHASRRRAAAQQAAPAGGRAQVPPAGAPVTAAARRARRAPLLALRRKLGMGSSLRRSTSRLVVLRPRLVLRPCIRERDRDGLARQQGQDALAQDLLAPADAALRWRRAAAGSARRRRRAVRRR